MFSKVSFYLTCILLSCNIGLSVGESMQIPYCECVNATVDCMDTVAINSVIAQLVDNSAICINGCQADCQQAFYYLHAYHELCQNAGLAAHEVYHDFSLACEICEPVQLVPAVAVTPENECPKVDCSNQDEQNALTNLLISEDCEIDCFDNQQCIQGWNKLSAYHESCEEGSLTALLTKEYHNIEIVCPPQCVLPVSNASQIYVSCDTMYSMVMDDGHDGHVEESSTAKKEMHDDDEDHTDENSSTPKMEKHDDHGDHDHDETSAPLMEDEHDHDEHDDDADHGDEDSSTPKMEEHDHGDHDHDETSAPKMEDEHDHDEHDEHHTDEDSSTPKMEEHDDYGDHDHDETSAPKMEDDHHDEHDHDEHEQGGLLSCECLIDAASFSCNNSDMLDEAISFLKGNTDVCINECSKNDACASAFYVLTTFHDVCPILSGEEGSLFHDFGLHCEGCNADSLLSSQSGGLECSEVDCSDTADQNALVDLLIDCGPACEQFQETTCQQAWYALTAYHETCAEESLTVAVTSSYHDFEEVCPAACVPKDRPLPQKPDCEAEMMTMMP